MDDFGQANLGGQLDSFGNMQNSLFSYGVSLGFDQAIQGFKQLQDVGTRSLESLESELADLQKRLEHFSEAHSRVVQNKGLYAFVRTPEGPKRYSREQIESAVKTSEIRGQELTTEITVLRNLMVRYDNVVKDVIRADNEFIKGLDKSPEKIASVKTAVQKLVDEIEKLEKIEKRNPFQQQSLERFKDVEKNLKITITDFHHLNQLEKENAELIERRKREQNALNAKILEEQRITQEARRAEQKVIADRVRANVERSKAVHTNFNPHVLQNLTAINRQEIEKEVPKMISTLGRTRRDLMTILDDVGKGTTIEDFNKRINSFNELRDRLAGKGQRLQQLGGSDILQTNIQAALTKNKPVSILSDEFLQQKNALVAVTENERLAAQQAREREKIEQRIAELKAKQAKEGLIQLEKDELANRNKELAFLRKDIEARSRATSGGLAETDAIALKEAKQRAKVEAEIADLRAKQAKESSIQAEKDERTARAKQLAELKSDILARAQVAAKNEADALKIAKQRQQVEKEISNQRTKAAVADLTKNASAKRKQELSELKKSITERLNAEVEAEKKIEKAAKEAIDRQIKDTKRLEREFIDSRKRMLEFIKTQSRLNKSGLLDPKELNRLEQFIKRFNDAKGKLQDSVNIVRKIQGTQSLVDRIEQRLGDPIILAKQDRFRVKGALPGFDPRQQLDKQIRALTSEYLKAKKAFEDLKKSHIGLPTGKLAEARKIMLAYEQSLQKAVDKAHQLRLETANVSRANAALATNFGTVGNTVGGIFRNLSRFGIVVFAIEQSVRTMLAPIYLVKKAFIDTNVQLEQAQLALAAAFNNKYLEDFSVSLRRSKKFVAELREEAVKTNLTFQELFQASTTALPQLLNRGASEKQALFIISRVSQAAKFALGEQFSPGRINDEIRGLLNKQIVGRTNETLQFLGITKEDLKNAKDIADIVELIDKKTRGLEAANREFQKTFLGGVDRMRDEFFLLATEIGKPLFREVTISLLRFNKAMQEGKYDGFITAMRGIILHMAKIVRLLDHALVKMEAFSKSKPSRFIKALSALNPGLMGAKWGNNFVNDDLRRTNLDAFLDLASVEDLEQGRERARKDIGSAYAKIERLKFQYNKFSDGQFIHPQKVAEANQEIQKLQDQIKHNELEVAKISAEIYKRKHGKDEEDLPDPLNRLADSPLGTGGEEDDKPKRIRRSLRNGLNQQKTQTELDAEAAQRAFDLIETEAKSSQTILAALSRTGIEPLSAALETLKERQAFVNQQFNLFSKRLTELRPELAAAKAEFERLVAAAEADPENQELADLAQDAEEKFNRFQKDIDIAEQQLAQFTRAQSELGADLIAKTFEWSNELLRVSQTTKQLKAEAQELDNSLNLDMGNKQLQQFTINSLKSAAAIEAIITQIKILNTHLSEGVVLENGVKRALTEEEKQAIEGSLQQLHLDLSVARGTFANTQADQLSNFINTIIQQVNQQIGNVQLQRGVLTQAEIDAFTLQMNDFLRQQLMQIANAEPGQVILVTDAKGEKHAVKIKDELIQQARETVLGIEAATRDIQRAYQVNIVDPLKNAFDTLFDNILQGSLKFSEVFINIFRDIVTQAQRILSKQLFDVLESRLISKNSGFFAPIGLAAPAAQAFAGTAQLPSAAEIAFKNISFKETGDLISDSIEHGFVRAEELKGTKAVGGAASVGGETAGAFGNLAKPEVLGGIAGLIGLGIAAKNIFAGQGDNLGAGIGAGVGGIGGGIIGALLAAAGTGGIGAPLGFMIGGGVGAGVGSQAGLMGRRSAAYGGAGALLGGLAGFAAGGSSVFAGTALGAKLGALGGPVGALVGALVGGAIGVFTGNFFSKRGAKKIEEIMKNNSNDIQRAAERTLEATTMKQLNQRKAALDAEFRQAEAELNNADGKGAKGPRKEALAELAKQRNELFKQIEELEKQIEKEIKEATKDLKQQISELKRPTHKRDIVPSLRKTLDELKSLLDLGVDQDLVFEYFELQIQDTVRVMQEELDEINKQLTQGAENERGELISLEEALKLRIEEIQKEAKEQLESLRQSYTEQANAILSEGRASAITPSVATRQERLANLARINQKNVAELNEDTQNAILREQNRTAREIYDLQKEANKLQESILFTLDQAIQLAPKLLEDYNNKFLKGLKSFFTDNNPFNQLNIPKQVLGGAGVTISELNVFQGVSDAQLGRLIKDQINREMRTKEYRRGAQR